MKHFLPKRMERGAELKNGYLAVKKQVYDSAFHYHNFYEFEFIAEGCATVSVNGRKYNLKKGGAYFLRPTDLHEFKASENTLIYSVSFLPEIIDGKLLCDFSSIGYIIAAVSDSDYDFICALLEKLLILSRNNYDKTTAENILNILLAQLLKYDRNKKNVVDEDGFYAALRYVNSSFTENPSLADACAVAGYSETYFCRKFKALTGKTYTEYLAGLKIDFASRLLRETGGSVTEICFASGFNSISQFIREFKRIENITPAAYRKKIKCER